LLDDLPLRALADAFRVSDIMDGVAFGLKEDALEFAGQKAARPLAGGDRLLPGLALGGQDDKTGQVPGIGPQTVEQPGAHAGASLDDRPAVHERVGRVVVNLLRLERANDAEIIRDALQPR